MNRGKFKFNAILRVLLLAGTVYANELPGENKAVPDKEMTAPSDKEFAGFAEAQFLYGVYCKEKLKDDKTAYRYLNMKKNYLDSNDSEEVNRWYLESAYLFAELKNKAKALQSSLTA